MSCQEHYPESKDRLKTLIHYHSHFCYLPNFALVKQYN